MIKNFEAQWKALKERIKVDKSDAPKITNTLLVIKWTQAFVDYLGRIIGHRTITFPYVVCKEVTVPVHATPLVPYQPHSEDHGPLEADLVDRAANTPALYRDDNSLVYYKLEEATCSIPYAAPIKPLQRPKYIRAACMALKSQYSGQENWKEELKTQDDMIHTLVWKGQRNFSLEKFIQQHRNAFVSMQSCPEYVQYQLPTEHTRVGYLISVIQCNGAGLQSAMASVQINTIPSGKRNRFEETATHILPYDPTAK